MTIKIGSLQRDETITAFNRARVGADVADLPIRAALDQFGSTQLSEFFYAHCFHRVPTLLKYSSTTCRSLNGTTVSANSWYVWWPLPAINRQSPGLAMVSARSMASRRSRIV